MQLVVIAADGDADGGEIDGLTDAGEAAVTMIDKEAVGVIVGDDGAGFEGSESGAAVNESVGQLVFAEVGGIGHGFDGGFVVEEAESGGGPEEGPVGGGEAWALVCGRFADDRQNCRSGGSGQAGGRSRGSRG